MGFSKIDSKNIYFFEFIYQIKRFNFKAKPWKECSNKCIDSEVICFEYEQKVKSSDYVNHLSKNFNYPNQYLTCAMCKKNQPFSGFRFEKAKFRLCVYLQRN